MPNKGIVPVDFDTPVGRFRQNTNDLAYTALDPPEAGFGDFRINSDAEIQGWLSQGNDSVFWALAWYYQTVADAAALSAKNITDQDLRISTEKRAELLQASADRWFRRAEDEDDEAGLTDIFVIANTNPNYCRCSEAAPCPVGCAGVRFF